ncbi:flagellar motor protein [Candidatus Nitrospira bockiana]
MDILTLLGVVIAVGSILGGQVLEGGHVSSIMQLTAFVIVIGGTLGAVCIQNPLSVVLKALSLLSLALFNPRADIKADIGKIIELANLSRKQGLLALEGKLKEVEDPFFKKGIQFIVDGTDPKMIQEILDVEVMHHEEEAITAAKVWDAAGGYAPTVGILGAVLGLIHVMENLADPSKLGSGIAVAFVATVYGVGAANLFFLPLGNKIKWKIKQDTAAKEMLVAGLVGVAQGDNPRMLQEKLESYLPDSQRSKEPNKG